MRPPPDARTEELFSAALERPAEERSAFLAEACGDDHDLRAQLEELLVAHRRAGGFFDRLSAGISASGSHELEAAARPRIRVGPYRAVSLLGSGGMGVVYRARRADGAFEQEVALKLLHLDMNQPHERARFLAERQILARLEHPHVARLLDGGVTEEGRPWFVMELVEGRPITDHCRERELDLAEVLELFADVVSAVAALHRRLIVHRDLKPSNLLVRDDGVVKLLDFGIAKLLDDERDPALTRTGERVLTPRYAAPEQLLGAPVGTAVDVYGLGLILYELLTGRPTFEDPTTGGVAAAARATSTPPAPSAVLRRTPSGAPSEGSGPPWSWRRLVGDLDRICLTALEPDPERRYASVERLADDLDRHRRGLPIAARPPTLRYRASKFARRHRFGVAVAILLGSLATAGFWRERSLRHEAEIARREQESVAGFLQRLLVSATPAVSQGRAVTVDEILGRASEELEAGLEPPLEPRVEAAVRATLGDAYLALSDYAAARSHLERALELRGGLDGGDPETDAVLQVLAELHLRDGDLELAERLARRLLERRVELHGEDASETLETLDVLAGIHLSQGRLEQAEAIDRRTLRIHRREHGDDDPRTLRSMSSLASTLFRRERYEEAAALYERALDGNRRRHGPEHPETLKALGNLAVSHNVLGRPREALPLLREVAESRARVLGEHHALTATSYHNLGVVLVELGRSAEAEAALQRAIEIRSRHTGSTGRLASLFVLAQARADRGLTEQAAELCRQVLEGQRRELGEQHPETLTTIMFLADLEVRRGALAIAEELLTPALEAIAVALGEQAPLRQRALLVLARLESARARHREAAELAAAAAAELGAQLGGRHPWTLDALYEEARARGALGHTDAARQRAREAWEGRREVLGPEHPAASEARRLLEELSVPSVAVAAAPGA